MDDSEPTPPPAPDGQASPPTVPDGEQSARQADPEVGVVGTDPELADDGEMTHRRWYQPPSGIMAAAVVAALLFLGGAVGWLLGEGEFDDGPNDADVGFLQDMITHHEQAIEMSWVVMATTEDSSVRSYAEEITFFQSRQIGLMHALLTEWSVSIDDRPEQAMGWMGMPVPLDQMPGLADADSMGALRSAEGATADELFLDLMIRHHIGGVHMAGDAVEAASDPRVRDLAEIMERHQRSEVGEFRRLQDRLGFDQTT